MNFKIFSWTNLRVLGKNRIVRSSYFWLVFVPIVAKILNTTADILSFKLFEQEIQITLGLPFSWKVLFFSALAFSVANIIFQLFCPQLIRDYPDFPEFEKSKTSDRQLYKLCHDFIIKWKANYLGSQADIPEREIKNFVNYNFYRHQGHLGKQRETGYVENFDVLPTIKENVIEDHSTIKESLETFEDLRQIQDKSYSYIRLLNGLFYTAGLILFTIIIGQNIYNVIRLL